MHLAGVDQHQVPALDRVTAKSVSTIRFAGVNHPDADVIMAVRRISEVTQPSLNADDARPQGAVRGKRIGVVHILERLLFNAAEFMSLRKGMRRTVHR